MKVRIWGARGSMPAPLLPDAIEQKIYQAIFGMPNIDTNDSEAVWTHIKEMPPLLRGTAGGNTACVEIQAGGETFIIDAGSGIRPLGLELMKGPCGRGRGKLHIFFSHPHWDHIQGFPIFLPAFVPGNQITFYSVHDLEQALTGQQRFLYFPVSLNPEQAEQEEQRLAADLRQRYGHIPAMRARQEFVRLEPGVPLTVGPLRVNTIRNHHPGDAFSYRFEDEDSVFVYASDAEYKELDDDSLQARLDFFDEADALIFDAQYGLRESWESKADYGHSSAMIGVDLARRAGVKRLVLFHHEPTYSDLQLQKVQLTAIAYQAQDDTLPICEVLVAYEGLTLDLTPVEITDWYLTAGSQAAIVTAGSTFDEIGVEYLTKQLERLAEQSGPAGSVLDLSRVERMTTAGLKALVNFSRQRTEGPLVLAAPSPAVEQVIKLGGYVDYFTIYPSIDEAIKAVRIREALNLPGQVINNRYQITETLGQDALGTILKVIDQKYKRPAALRIPSPMFGVKTIERFAGQMRALLDLDHSAIARVYDCAQSLESHRFFIVEELLAGSTLAERLQDNAGPLTLDEMLDLALNLTLALEYAHSHGVIHGNLKPQSIFLTPKGVKISGFGLGHLEEGRNLLESPVLFLSIPYLAPEQILGQPLDARSDLYALGVLLYQLFSGCLPFTGSEREVLQAHLEQDPPPLRSLNPDLSRSVEYFILKLLAKNPNDRYAGAKQARRILSSLIFGTGEISWPGKRQLVGRDKELQTLQTCWAEAQAGQGQLVFLTGEAGIGKTRLAQELALYSETGVVLTGHCRGKEGGSYQPFAEALQIYLAAAPPEIFDQEARHLLGNFSQLVPQLRQIDPDLPTPAPLEPRQEQLRLISSLAQFIKCAARSRPWLFILEDLQGVDESSLEMLRYLGRHLSEMALLIVATYRDDEIDRRHPLQAALHDLSRTLTYRRLPLERLTQTDVGRMLSYRWDSTTPDNLVERIYERTGGNPLYVDEVAKGLEENGLVTMQHGRWRFPGLESVRFPQSVYDAVEGRIHYLSAETRDLLAQAAVLGQTFQFDDLTALSGSSEWTVLEHLDLALERQLIQEVSGGKTLRFTHSEIRQAIYDDLGRLRRRRLHRRAGEMLEQRTRPESEGLAEDLAHHFSQAGEVEKALVYSLQTARRAKKTYANETALRWYGQALEMLDQLDPEKITSFQRLKLSLYQEQGDVLTFMTRWSEARASYRQALTLAELSDDQSAQAWIQAAMGELLWKQGALGKAWKWLEEAQIIFTKLGDQRGMGEVLRQKGTVMSQQGNFEKAQALYEVSLAIHRSLVDKVNEANLLNNLGVVAQNQGDLERAQTLIEKSLKIRRELQNSWGVAISLSNLGFLINLAQGDTIEAQTFLEEAIAIQREIGDQFYLAITLNNLGNVFRDRGDYAMAHSIYEESLIISQALEAPTENIFDLLEDIASLAALEGQYERALHLFGAAEGQREVISAALSAVERDKLDRLLAPARQALGQEAAGLAVTKGRAMSLAETIEYALQTGSRQ